jgi:hypothetical protein
VPALLADSRAANITRAVFYSDSVSPSVCHLEGPSINNTVPPPACVDSAPLELEDVEPLDPFLNTTIDWFVNVQQVLFFVAMATRKWRLCHSELFSVKMETKKDICILSLTS